MQLQKAQTDAHQITHSLISATLFHLDGTQSEIELKMPLIASCSDGYWMSAHYLENYINRLSSFYNINIKAFQFTQFYLLDNGDKRVEAGQGELHEIPLNKLWNEKEGWIDLRRAKELHRQSA